MKDYLLITLLMINKKENRCLLAVVQLQAHNNYPDGIIRYINKVLKSRDE